MRMGQVKGHRTIGRRFFFMMVLFLLVGMALGACKIQEERYVPGTYEGVSEGYHGPIRVEVTTSAFEIESIVIVEEHEKQVLGEVVDIVYETIPERVRRYNSTEVDVVSGATMTSTALIEAIQDGLNKALIEPEEVTDKSE